MLKLDHLAIAAQSLTEGCTWTQEALGVSLEAGGKHAHFGTHNMLLGLEDGLYLEVIAIDPDAPTPDCPRWFALDRFGGHPRLNNWICRTPSLVQQLRFMPQAGNIVELTRGDLRWQMAVPEDGILPFDGMYPALIEWHGSSHPSSRLKATGCRLKRLVISHPDAGVLASTLVPAMDDTRVVFESGDIGLSAEFDTPRGKRVLQ